MQRILVILLCCFSAIILFSAEITGKVIAVSDGDTLTVLDSLDRVPFCIRLAKIDAPEKKQAFGARSKQFLSALVHGKTVRIRFTSVDRYRRLIGLVYCEDREINLILVQEGLAWHYSDYDETPSYIAAEQAARKAKKGLWGEPRPVRPVVFRSGQNREETRPAIQTFSGPERNAVSPHIPANRSGAF